MQKQQQNRPNRFLKPVRSYIDNQKVINSILDSHLKSITIKG